MRTFRRKGVRQIAYPEEPTLVGYCRNCGSSQIDVYEQGSFVLVAPPGRQPFYAKIVRTELDKKDGPVAVVERGAGEKEIVPLESLNPVSREVM